MTPAMRFRGREKRSIDYEMFFKESCQSQPKIQKKKLLMEKRTLILIPDGSMECETGNGEHHR